jgi:DNA-binding CsgD family transcriptional regulator
LSLDPLTEVLETIEHGIVLVGSDTYPCYTNSAAEELLSSDPDRAVLTRELRAISTTALNAKKDQRAESEVGTKAGYYRLSATLLKEGIKEMKSRAVLVTIHRAATPQPSVEVLTRRFGFTAREAGVALLLGRGAGNARIASELHISPHTARHHTERVLTKLNVHGRGEVARALLGLSANDQRAG